MKDIAILALLVVAGLFHKQGSSYPSISMNQEAMYLVTSVVRLVLPTADHLPLNCWFKICLTYFIIFLMRVIGIVK